MSNSGPGFWISILEARAERHETLTILFGQRMDAERIRGQFRATGCIER